MSITPVLHTVQCAQPCVDDIFASMAGGEKLSKTVFAQAYIQMEVKESSRKLLAINGGISYTDSVCFHALP